MPALPGLNGLTNLSDTRRAATRCGVRGGEPRPTRPPPITRIALPACCAHYPGGSQQVHCPVSFPAPCCLPRYPGGSGVRIATFEAYSGFTRYGPLARSAAQGGLCHRASVRSLANRLSATRSNRILSRWNLPPLATRAYGAHWATAPAPTRPVAGETSSANARTTLAENGAGGAGRAGRQTM